MCEFDARGICVKPNDCAVSRGKLAARHNATDVGTGIARRRRNFLDWHSITSAGDGSRLSGGHSVAATTALRLNRTVAQDVGALYPGARFGQVLLSAPWQRFSQGNGISCV